MGIILFVMLSGHFPFKGQNERDLFSKISRGMFHLPETLPYESKRLIQKMLSVDPAKRPTAKDVRIIFIKVNFSYAKIDGFHFQRQLGLEVCLPRLSPSLLSSISLLTKLPESDII